jgi:hypothetical protein
VTRTQAIKRAVVSSLMKASEKGLNSVEIASLAVRRMFGLYRARVKLNFRNLQPGPFLKKLDDRHRVEYRGHERGLATLRNRKGLYMKAM